MPIWKIPSYEFPTWQYTLFFLNSSFITDYTVLPAQWEHATTTILLIAVSYTHPAWKICISRVQITLIWIFTNSKVSNSKQMKKTVSCISWVPIISAHTTPKTTWYKTSTEIQSRNFFHFELVASLLMKIQKRVQNLKIHIFCVTCIKLAQWNRLQDYNNYSMSNGSKNLQNMWTTSEDSTSTPTIGKNLFPLWQTTHYSLHSPGHHFAVNTAVTEWLTARQYINMQNQVACNIINFPSVLCIMTLWDSIIILKCIVKPPYIRFNMNMI